LAYSRVSLIDAPGKPSRGSILGCRAVGKTTTRVFTGYIKLMTATACKSDFD